MSHLALYREFRPKTFDEVIAQNHIVETLKHQVQSGNISHAYLFCGTRGTGKTSCAKIFAKAVNCLHNVNGSPCCECEVCKAIGENGNFDIVEIDAASNNRVDEIRDLREKVNYLPSIAKYKVYIIDEVHMLTDSAFNALLKTLEEPPKHVIFILATTEPEKLPATILSRCMRFDFKLVSEEELAGQLEKIFTKTKTQFEPKALNLIAKAGHGSVRDTLSVAEMCKAFSNDNITYDSVEECLGLTDDKTLFEIAKAIAEHDGKTVIENVDRLYVLGKNMNSLLGDLCEFFKNVLALKFSPNYDLKLPQDVLLYHKQIADMCDQKYLIDCLKKLADSMQQIKYSFNDKVFVEVSLLGLFYNDNLEIENLKQKIKKLEDVIGNASHLEIPQTKTAEMPIQKKVQSNLMADDVKKNDALNQNRFEAVSENMSQKIFDDSKSQTNTKNVIFGDLIGYARDCGEMMLSAGFQDVKNFDLVGTTFVFECKTQDLADMILEHKNLILSRLSQKYGIKDIKAEVYVDKAKKNIEELSNLLDGKLTIKD